MSRRQVACSASRERQNKHGRYQSHDFYLAIFLDFCVKGSWRNPRRYPSFDSVVPHRRGTRFAVSSACLKQYSYPTLRACDETAAQRHRYQLGGGQEGKHY